MFWSVFRQTLPRICTFAIFTLGMSALAGCASRPENGVAFRRFWGFDQAPNSAASTEAPPAGGMIPKFWERENTLSAWSQDPFLAQDSQAASGSTGPVTGTVNQNVATAGSPTEPGGDSFAAPVIVPSPRNFRGSQPIDGNPFRVVEHQAPVSDISSAERPRGSLPPEAGGASQLDRLKNALSRDAKTPPPQKLSAEGSEVARQRVETMMKNARRQLQLGEYVSALRWAMAAEQLAARSELFFGPEEDPPADLVRSLQDHLKVPREPIVPSIALEPTIPAVSPNADLSETPEFSIALPEISPRGSVPVPEPAPEIPMPPNALPHTTRAMQEAVIAPETLTHEEEDFPEQWPAPGVIDPSQRHARSLKIDARRVSANHGAVVSVEGQLNPPIESRMPEVPLAPPVMEDNAELPPFAAVMTEPAPLSTTTPPPPLPPPSVMEQPPEPSPFLYADTNLPAPEPKKNVQWDELDLNEPANDWGWWIFPAMGITGVVLLGVLLLKRKRT